MSATLFSFLMAIFWSDIFTVLIFLLLRRKSFIENLSTWPLVVLIIMSLIRLLGIVEFPFVHIFRSEKMFPAVVCFFEKRLFQAVYNDVTVRMIDLFYLVWIGGSVILFCLFLLQEYRFRKEMNKEAVVPEEYLEELCRRVTGNKTSKLRIVLTPATQTPMIAGVFRPTVYLPTDLYS